MAERVMKSYKVVVYDIKRHSTSRNGNPRYQIATDQGVFYTGVDASLAYGITNYTNQNFPDTYILNQPGVELHGDSIKAIWFISLNGLVLQ